MTKKCLGCGINLQFTDSHQEGYTTKETNTLCERCFRIKNYNDYKVLPRGNNDFIPILEMIGKTKDLVILVIDILNIPYDLTLIKEYLTNDIFIVFSKRDVLPDSLWEEKLLKVADTLGVNYIDKTLVSSKNNYQLDLLYESINDYKKSNNVYIVGFTNAGKSSLINKLIYNYSDLNYELTTSMLPSTTLDMLEINLNEQLTLIDTPGLIEEGSIYDYLDIDMIKKISSLKTIDPLVYQVRGKQTFTIEDFMNIICEDNNLVFYLPNKLNITHSSKEKIIPDLQEYTFDIKNPCDIVISGLGFIKVVHPGIVKLQILKGVKVYTRPSII